MKKVFTLLTLLVAMATSAWGENQTTLISGVTLPDVPSNTLDLSSQTDYTADANGWIVSFTKGVIDSKGWHSSISNDGGSTTWSVPSGATAPFSGATSKTNRYTLQDGSGGKKTHAIRFTGAEAASFLVSYGSATKMGTVSLYTYVGTTQTLVETKVVGTSATWQELLFTSLSASTTYIAYIYGNSGSDNSDWCEFALKAPAANAPTITTQPVGGTYVSGYAIPALTVAATASAGVLSYQWYSCDDAVKTNAAAISGATNAAYTPSASKFYFCRVTDSNGSTDSDVVEVTISPAAAPSFVSITPSTTSVSKGTASTITAVIAGNPVPTIQWFSCDDALKTNPVAIGGATALTLNLENTVAGTFYYYAVASNSEGNAASEVKTITVTDPDVDRTGYNTYYVAKDETTVNGAKVNCDDIVMEYQSGGTFDTASEDNMINALNSNYVASIKSGTNGWGVEFSPSANGRLSVGVVINNDKTFSITNVDEFNYIDKDGNKATNDGKTWAPSTKFYGIITINVSSGTTYKFKVDGSKMQVYGFEFTPTSGAASATIATSGYTTYASASALDFANAIDPYGCKNLTAFVVSSVTKESVTLTTVESAPASTGVVLKGTASTAYTIPVSASPAAVGTNKLTASVSGATVAANSVYVVSGGKFCLYTGTSIPAGKAYLDASEIPAGASELTLDLNSDSSTTGIESVESVQRELLNGDFYNLNGQRVAQPTKGLYIVNGKKVIIK